MIDFKKLFSYLLIIFGVSLVGFGQFDVEARSGDGSIVIDDMNVKMELSRDSQKYSKLKTTETIQVQFNDNSHHGIYKRFVDRYNNHTTNFSVVSVEDSNGQPVDHHIDGEKLYIGSSSSYVSGAKYYKIVYTQDYVTRHYDDTDKDEFYWDVIGAGWDVPIRNASAELVLKDDLKGKVATNINCYYGMHGESRRCETAYKKDDKFYTNVSNIGNGKGMTIAIGFPSGTFKEYKKPLAEKIFDYVAGWFIIQCFLLFPFGFIIYIIVQRKLSRIGKMGTIIPEYTPPKNMSIITAASIASKYTYIVQNIEVSQLLRLAVEGYVQIYEKGEATFFKRKDYIVKIVKDITTANQEDAEIIYDMFGSVDRSVSVGSEMNINDINNNTKFRLAIYDNRTKFKNSLDPYFDFNEEVTDKIKRVLIIFTIISVLTLSFAFAVLFMVSTVIVSKAKVAKDEGLQMARYLLGLKMYIEVAEKDRINMLQSPDTAEKIAQDYGLDIKDRKQLIKLYEKTLPYAVMFGQERKWTKELGKFYEQEGVNPSWYSSTSGIITANALSSGISSMSYSAISSSSGGSSGGGSVGGGGGGGGGGGW